VAVRKGKFELNWLNHWIDTLIGYLPNNACAVCMKRWRANGS